MIRDNSTQSFFFGAYPMGVFIGVAVLVTLKKQTNSFLVRYRAPPLAFWSPGVAGKDMASAVLSTVFSPSVRSSANGVTPCIVLYS